MVLLGYNLFGSTIIGNVETDFKLCKNILDEKVAKYPKGIFFLFFKGRFHLVQVTRINEKMINNRSNIHFMKIYHDLFSNFTLLFNLKGEISQATKWYKLACDSEWPQFDHLCYWELLWCYQFSQDWWSAIHYADLLLKESKWSKTCYSYVKAAFMCMVQDELTDEQRKEQIALMT